MHKFGLSLGIARYAHHNSKLALLELSHSIHINLRCEQESILISFNHIERLVETISSTNMLFLLCPIHIYST